MKNLKLIIGIALLTLSINYVSAQTEPIDKNGLANGGYDLVSYFTDSKATKGNDKFSVEIKGVKYLFASEAHQKAFKANPKSYLPQVDGYCAWAIAEKSAKVSVNPETFKVVNGKLYLFFNGDFNGSPFNTLPEWNKDEKNLLAKLPENWAAIR